MLVAFCPPRGSSWQVGSIVHSPKHFRCHSLAAPLPQKVIGTFFQMSPQRIFTVVLCPKGWSRETWACHLQSPGGSTGVLQFIYTEAGFAARFEPPTPPTVILLGTSCSPTISPILSREEQRSSCLTVAPHRSLGAIVESSDGNNLPKGSVPLTRSAPCPPAFSVTDCGELGRKWLPLFKSYVPQTQSYDGQRTSKLSSWRNTLTALSSLCHSTGSGNGTEGGLIHLGENKASFKSFFIYSSQLCWVYRFNQLFP